MSSIDLKSKSWVELAKEPHHDAGDAIALPCRRRDLPRPMSKLRSVCFVGPSIEAPSSFLNFLDHTLLRLPRQSTEALCCPHSVAMLVRSVPRCATKLRPAVARANLRYAKPQCRRYSMPSSAASPVSQSSTAMLAPLLGELDRLAPSFKINGSQVQILQTPAEFYETLKVRDSHGSRWQMAG
jgi:hypothetical protein